MCASLMLRAQPSVYTKIQTEWYSFTKVCTSVRLRASQMGGTGSTLYSVLARKYLSAVEVENKGLMMPI